MSSKPSTPSSPNKVDNNIKGKLSDIYGRLEKIDNHSDEFQTRIKSLENESSKSGDDITENLKAINSKIDAEVRRVLDELDHRFALQVAENKRVAAQLAQSKADYHALLEKVNTLEDRMREMEAEIGQ